MIFYREGACLLIEVHEDDGTLAIELAKITILPLRIPLRVQDWCLHFYDLRDAGRIKTLLAEQGQKHVPEENGPNARKRPEREARRVARRLARER